jgi:type II secretory pathway pseudopilin PulG
MRPTRIDAFSEPVRFLAGGSWPRSLRGQQGFAILEILMGGVVLAIAVLALAIMFSEGQSFAVADGDDRVALALAQEKVEHVKSLGFNCIPAPAGPGTVNPGAANTAMPLTIVGSYDISSCAKLPTDPNFADFQAALTFNETPLGRYVSRQTQVFCADAVTLAPSVTGCATAKFIRVQVTPTMAKGRGARVDTVMTLH